MIHPTAEISSQAFVDPQARIWHYVQVREGARIGRNCILGKDVYVDTGVRIGDNCKLQNGVQVFHGAIIEDGVFLGPRACVLNDKTPRAINLDGELKSDADWQVGPVLIKRGASVGAGALVLPNVTVGEFALVGAGAVVTADVPAHALVVGNPARCVGYVCQCGHRLMENQTERIWTCSIDKLCYALDGKQGLKRQA